MNPATDIAWICQHQDLVTAALAWAFGVMPVASIAAWFTAKKTSLPPIVQAILQVLAGNLAHAVAGTPIPDKSQ